MSIFPSAIHIFLTLFHLPKIFSKEKDYYIPYLSSMRMFMNCVHHYLKWEYRRGIWVRGWRNKFGFQCLPQILHQENPEIY